MVNRPEIPNEYRLLTPDLNRQSRMGRLGNIGRRFGRVKIEYIVLRSTLGNYYIANMGKLVEATRANFSDK